MIWPFGSGKTPAPAQCLAWRLRHGLSARSIARFHDGSGKRATGVTFVDTSGEEWEQPADLVILAAFSVFNVQLLMMSGVGKPYDPVANQGVIVTDCLKLSNPSDCITCTWSAAIARLA